MITPKEALAAKRITFLQKVNQIKIDEYSKAIDDLLRDSPGAIDFRIDEKINYETLFALCKTYADGGWSVDYRFSKTEDFVNIYITAYSTNTSIRSWAKLTYEA